MAVARVGRGRAGRGLTTLIVLLKQRQKGFCSGGRQIDARVDWSLLAGVCWMRDSEKGIGVSALIADSMR